MSNLDQFVVQPCVSFTKILVTCDCCDKQYQLLVPQDDIHSVLEFPVHTCTTCENAMAAHYEALLA